MCDSNLNRALRRVYGRQFQDRNELFRFAIAPSVYVSRFDVLRFAFVEMAYHHRQTFDVFLTRHSVQPTPQRSTGFSPRQQLSPGCNELALPVSPTARISIRDTPVEMLRAQAETFIRSAIGRISTLPPRTERGRFEQGSAVRSLQPEKAKSVERNGILAAKALFAMRYISF